MWRFSVTAMSLNHLDNCTLARSTDSEDSTDDRPCDTAQAGILDVLRRRIEDTTDRTSSPTVNDHDGLTSRLEIARGLNMSHIDVLSARKGHRLWTKRQLIGAQSSVPHWVLSQAFSWILPLHT